MFNKFLYEQYLPIACDNSVISLSLKFSLRKFRREYKASGTLGNAFCAKSSSVRFVRLSMLPGMLFKVRCVSRMWSVSKLINDGSCLQQHGKPENLF